MALAVSAGCGSESTGSTSGSAGDGGQATTSSTVGGQGGTTSSNTGGVTGGAGGAGGSTGGGGPALPPACVQTCGVAADCASASPLFGADNYECAGGLCKYKGCISTQECTDAYQSPAWECAPIPGLSIKSCVQKCGAAADCASASPLFGADNYECAGGLCEYKGCNSTQECVDAYQSPSWACQ